MPIPLSTFLPIHAPNQYKLHLACWNGEDQPLDVFIRDRAEWDGWNKWRSYNDEFNREFIFSLVHFYHETDIWLFGGIYKVLERNPVNYSRSYKIESVSGYDDLIGRLKVVLPRPGRSRSVKLENYYDQISVSELLKEPYTGAKFPGSEDISCDFTTLETVFRMGRPDWKAALENVKGVYLIVDKSNGKKYVGSAYGDMGIWSRWQSYINTAHGGNDELIELIEREGIEYARKNFRISLLEYRPARTDDQLIIAREGFWKEALLSRVPLGYNIN